MCTIDLNCFSSELITSPKWYYDLGEKLILPFVNHENISLPLIHIKYNILFKTYLYFTSDFLCVIYDGLVFWHSLSGILIK